MSDLPKLGLIAGGGSLPVHIARTCLTEGRPLFVIVLDGFADPDDYQDVPHAVIRVGAAGRMLEQLKTEQVQDVVLAGPVKRPSYGEIRPDMKGAAILAKAGMKTVFGDDNLLKAIVSEIESQGFRVVGAHEIAGGYIARDGLLGNVPVPADHEIDITRGIGVLEALGPVDVGQAVVVQEQLVLGIEAIEGTDALIARCAAHVREGRSPVLVKIAKPGQDRRVDMPTIGVETVESAKKAGFAGIVIEAGNTLIIDPDRVSEAADQTGLFIRADRPGARGS